MSEASRKRWQQYAHLGRLLMAKKALLDFNDADWPSATLKREARYYAEQIDTLHMLASKEIKKVKF